MAKQLNINLAFTADTAKAKQQIADLQKTLSELTSKNMATNNLFNIDQIKQATDAAKELRNHLAAATDVNTGKLNLSAFSASLKSSGKSLQQYKVDLESLGPAGESAFLKVARSIAMADAPMRKTNTLLKEFSTTLMNTARWQISSSILHGFMGAVQSAYSYAQDLNESLNNIRIVTGQNTDQMAQFAEQANKAAQALNTTTTAYTDAALIYYQQGIRDQSEIADRTETTIKLANVSRQSAEEVSSQMTAIWNNFDDGNKALEYYADVITALGATTAASSEEIAGGMEKFAAVAETVGLSYEYAASALATIIATTRQSEDAVGTSLRTIFSRLEGLKLGETLEDGVDLNKYSKALETIGVNIMDATGNLKEMDTILDETAAHWDSLDRSQKVAFATTVGGVRQYTNLIALMDSWDMMQENISTARGSEGTLQKQADIYAESWEAASKRVKASLESIYSTVIDDKFFISLNNGFADLLQGVKGFIDGFGGIKGIIGAVAGIFLQRFAKEVPNALDNLKQNLMQTFSIAKQIADEIQNQNLQDLREIAKTAMINYSEGSGSLDFAVQSDGLTLLAEKKQQLNALTETYSATERQAAEQEIADLERAIDMISLQAQEYDRLEQTEESRMTNLSRVLANSASESAKSEIGIKNLTETIHILLTELQDPGKSIGVFKSLQDTVKKITPDLYKTQRGAEQVRNSFSSMNNIIQNSSSIGAKTKAEFSSFISEMNELDLSVDDNRQKLEIWGQIFEGALDKNLSNAKSKLDEIRNQLSKQLGINIDNAQLLKFLQTLEQMGMLSTDARTALAGLGASFEDLKPHVASSSEALTSTVGALMQLRGIITAWTGLADAFSEDTTFAEKLGAVIGALTYTYMAFHAVSKLTTILTTLETAAKEKSIIATALQTAASKGSVKAGLQVLFGKKAETAAHLGNAAAETTETGTTIALESALAPLLIVTLALAAALAVLVGLGYGISAAFKAIKDSTPEGKLQKATEAAKEAADAYNQIKDAYDNLVSSIEDYQNARSAINDLKEGTVEWCDAIETANQKALELLATYPELAQYMSRLNGQIIISDAGFERIKSTVSASVRHAETANYGAQVRQNQAQNDVNNKGDFYNNSITGQSLFVSQSLMENLQDYINKEGTDWLSSANAIKEVIRSIYGNDYYSEEALDNLSTMLADNASDIINLNQSIQANTEANRLLTAEMSHNEMQGNFIYDTLDAPTQNLVDQIIAEEYQKALNEKGKLQYAGSEYRATGTDKTVQQQYADYMGYRWVSNNNKGDQAGTGTYYDAATGQNFDLSDEYVREQLAYKNFYDAQRARINEIINSEEEFFDGFDEKQVELIKGLISNDQSNLQKIYGEAFNAADFDLQGIDATKLNNLAIALGRESGEALLAEINSVLASWQVPETIASQETDQENIISEIQTYKTAASNIKEGMSFEDYTKFKTDSGINWGGETYSSFYNDNGELEYRKQQILKWEEFLSLSVNQQQAYLTSLSQGAEKALSINLQENIAALYEELEDLNKRNEELTALGEKRQELISLRDSVTRHGDTGAIERYDAEIAAIDEEIRARNGLEVAIETTTQQIAADTAALAQNNYALTQSVTSLSELKELTDSGLNLGYDAISDTLIRLAENYENCTNELNAYNQALARGSEEQITTAQLELEAAIAAGEAAAAYGIEADYLEILTDSFGDYNDELSKGDGMLKSDAEAAKDAAVRYARLNEAIEDLYDNYDKYEEVLNDLKKAESDQDKAFVAASKSGAALKKSLAGLLDTSEDLLDANFLDAIDPKDLEKAAMGDEKAIKRIRDAFIDAQAAAADLADDPSLEKFKNDLDSLADGAIIDINDEPFLKALIEAQLAAGATAEDIENLLSGFSIDADVTPLANAMTEAEIAAANAAASTAQSGDAIVGNLSFDAEANSETVQNVDRQEDAGFVETLIPHRVSVVDQVLEDSGSTTRPIVQLLTSFEKTVTPTPIEQDVTKEQTVTGVKISNAHKSAGGNVSGSNKTTTSPKSSGGGSCFASGTLISMIGQFKNIEDIQIGDIVLSYNENIKRNEYSTVLQTMIHNTTEEIYTLSIENEDLVVTGIHRFYIKREEKIDWIHAYDLQKNDYVRFANGTWHQIEKISVAVKTLTVYNFEVSDNHNYYVGKNQILAHNKGGGGGSTRKAVDPVEQKDRYHVITKQINSLVNVYDRLAKAKDRAYGANRLKLMEQEAKNIQEQIDKQDELIGQVEAYMKIDRGNLQSGKNDIQGLDYYGLTAEYDIDGNIVNWDQIQAAALAKVNEAIGQYNSGLIDDDAKEAAEKQYEGFLELVEQYEETNEKFQEEMDKRQDLLNQIQDLNYEKLSYELEIRLKLRDADLKKIEYQIKKLGDSFFTSAEALSNLFSLQGNSEANITLEKLNIYRDQVEKLNEAYEQGEISQDNFIEGLEEARDGLYEELEAILDLNDEIKEWYSDTLSKASEELEKFTDQIEHNISVVEHLQDILSLMGKETDYTAIGYLLSSQYEQTQSAYEASKAYAETMKNQRDAAQAAYDAAVAEGNTAALETLKANLDAAINAANDAEEQALSNLQRTLETGNLLIENELQKAKQNIDNLSTGGKGWDYLNQVIELSERSADRYLTKTNQIYETNKLLRSIQQDIDKTTNNTAKQKLANFSKEIDALQKTTKLSKNELEIAKAQYEVLKAQIALEDARDAKSTVRLQRDSGLCLYC